MTEIRSRNNDKHSQTKNVVGNNLDLLSSKKDSLSSEELNEIGLNYLNNDKPNKALEKFQQAYFLNPNNLEIIFNIGLSYYCMNKPHDALEKLQEARDLAILEYRDSLKTQSEDLEDKSTLLGVIYCNMGNIQNDLDMLAEAKKSYFKALSHGIRTADIYNSLADILIEEGRKQPEIRQGRKLSALKCHVKSIRLDPENFNANIGLAEASLSMGNVENAEGMAKRCIILATKQEEKDYALEFLKEVKKVKKMIEK